ncbi:MAG: urease accessory protein UreF, partial [Planktomarina sp.]
MGMGARTAMHINAVLTLTQWLSPAYPVGSFAYSHGLETAVENGWVKDGTQLEAWLQTILHHGAGFADALFLAAAWKAQTPDQINAIDTQAKAFAASKERLFETTQQGGA